MDPTTIIAVSCQVVDTLCQLRGITKEIYYSAEGFSRQRERLSESIKDMTLIYDRIQDSCTRLGELGALSENGDDTIQTVVNKCQGLTSSLTTLLEQGRSGNPHSIRGALKAAGRFFLDRKSIHDLQVDLERNQHNLHLALTASVSVQVTRVLNALESTRHHGLDVSQQLKSTQLKLEDSSANLSNNLQQILSLFKRAQEVQRLDVIMKTLYGYLNSTQPNPRYDEVSEASANTYEWIFREPVKLFDVEPGLEILFPDWLRHGEGIFHILGKPGAGKSTLMKFIWKHHMRSILLVEWAGSSQLLCMRYFFWPQSNQDGLPGLKCSLLMSALSQAPELIEVLFPEIGDCYERLGSFLSQEKISQAVDLLLGNSEALERYKIFLLIDGLDEFDEKKGTQDYHDLVRLIQSWVSRSGGRVKICVSSREYEALMTITRHQKIRLQNLTRQDMRTFVAERLETHYRYPELKARENEVCTICEVGHFPPRKCHIGCLIDHIVNRSDGVFLWTRLAMGGMRKHMGTTSSPCQVWKYVDAQPKPLIDFITHMFNSIPPLYRREAYILLAIVYVYAFERQETEPPWVRKSILAQGASCLWEKLVEARVNPSYKLPSSGSTFVHRGDRHIFKAEEVNAQFNGLLEISSSTFTGAPTQYLVLSHRSIIEVLNNEINLKLLEHGVTAAELGEWACQLALDEIAILLEGPIIDANVNYKVGGLIAFLARLNLLGNPQILQQLEQIEDEFLIYRFGTRSLLEKEWVPFHYPDCVLSLVFHIVSYLVDSKFPETVPWILKRLKDVPRRGCLMSAVYWTCMQGPYGSNDYITIITMLLEHGFLGKDLLERQCDIPIHKYGCHTTEPWYIFVANLLVGELEVEVDRWTIVELWLDHGANPQIGALYERSRPPLSFTSDTRRLVDIFAIVVKLNGEWIQPLNSDLVELKVRPDNMTKSSRVPNMSLRDFIVRSNAPNKLRLLELIGRNIALMEEAEATDTAALFEELPLLDMLEVSDYKPLHRTRGKTRRTHLIWLRNTSSEAQCRLVGTLILAIVVLLLSSLIIIRGDVPKLSHGASTKISWPCGIGRSMPQRKEEL